MKKLITFVLFTSLLFLLAACGGNEETSTQSGEKEKLVFGATAGPYSDMVKKAIKPILEDQGYKVEVKEFSDYVQPNLSLANGSLDANLFQHKVYMDAFAQEHGLNLSEVKVVPTAPMGIYSKKYDDLESIEEGSTITIANDPTNLARTLLMLEKAGLVTIKEGVDPLRASEKDVAENPKNLNFEPIEAAQLPRAADNTDLSAVPGNYALAAGMDLLDAIVLEEMPDDYRNRVVINTEDQDADFVQDIKEAVESAEFEQTINEQFKGFGKPNWMKE